MNDKLFFREEIQKRKDQLGSHKSRISIEGDRTEFTVDLNEIQKEKKSQPKPTGVIEQFFPLASILGPQGLVPYSYEQQERLFYEMDFAKEEMVEDKPYVAKSLSEEMNPSLVKKVPSEKDKISIEDRIIEVSDGKDEGELAEVKRQVEQAPDKQESLEKHATETRKSREDVITTESSTVQGEIMEEKDAETFASKQVVQSIPLIDKTVASAKCTSIVVAYSTKELAAKLSDSYVRV